MDRIEVSIHYPINFDLEVKDIKLTQTELIGLMKSDRMGSEGKYFRIKDKIFEDTEDGYSITIILDDENKKEQNTPLPFVGCIEGIPKK